MTTKTAREIVKAGERVGLSHKEMAEICRVSVVTISRWKITGRARTSVISRLERHLKSLTDKDSLGKYLDEANLEDLAERARHLGFRVTFTDVKGERDSDISTELSKGEKAMFFGKRIKNTCDRGHVEELCELLINGNRGRTLGREIMEQLHQKSLNHSTYARLSRWVNPYKSEPIAQPIAAEISMELFGEEIQRIE
jgi:hypothetical protein